MCCFNSVTYLTVVNLWGPSGSKRRRRMMIWATGRGRRQESFPRWGCLEGEYELYKITQWRINVIIPGQVTAPPLWTTGRRDSQSTSLTNWGTTTLTWWPVRSSGPNPRHHTLASIMTSQTIRSVATGVKNSAKVWHKCFIQLHTCATQKNFLVLDGAVSFSHSFVFNAEPALGLDLFTLIISSLRINWWALVFSNQWSDISQVVRIRRCRLNHFNMNYLKLHRTTRASLL